MADDETAFEERVARQRARREAAAAEREKRASSGGIGNIFKRQYSTTHNVFIGALCGLFFLGLIGTLLPQTDTRSPEEKEASRQAIRQDYRDTMVKVTCEQLIKKNLRDPDSYKRESWTVANGVAYISYRAKNGFGGYARESRSCSLSGDKVFISRD